MSSEQDKKNTLEKIQEELNCIICNGLVDDPHSLFCGHSFCGQCIMAWLKTKKACPMCRVSVVRQPVHVTVLQNIADILRPGNVISEKRLERTDWLDLFPVDNNVTYIRDEDEDGIILRCSQCGWELDEDQFCGACNISYNVDNIDTTIEVTDTESHHDQDEEDLSDFVVDDDQVMYSSDNTQDMLINDADDDDEEESIDRYDRSNVIEIDDDDDEEEIVRSSRKRKIQISSDEDSDEDSNADISMVFDNSEEEEDLQGEELISDEEEEFSEPYFERSNVSRFIDDYAEDSDEEEIAPKPPKIDKITENISKAKDRMQTSLSKFVEIKSSSSDSSDSSDSDAPDYENMFITSQPSIDTTQPSQSSQSSKVNNNSSQAASSSTTKLDNHNEKKKNEKKKDKKKKDKKKKDKKKQKKNK